jgi:hypothetical protein
VPCCIIMRRVFAAKWSYVVGTEAGGAWKAELLYDMLYVYGRQLPALKRHLALSWQRLAQDKRPTHPIYVGFEDSGTSNFAIMDQISGWSGYLNLDNYIPEEENRMGNT